MTKIKVYVLKKRHSYTGNPVYELFIEGHNDKINGLRKLKAPFTYSVQSYNLRDNLQYSFKGKTIEIIDER
jgi:hypothetical protein